MLKKFNYSKYLISFTLVFFAFGCGDDRVSRNQVSKNIRLATDSEILSDSVVAGSYIVAFKSPRAYESVEPEYFLEYQKGFLDLREKAYDQPSVKNLRFLATIDLGVEQESLGLDLQEIFLAKPNDIEKKDNAHIVEVQFASNLDAKVSLHKWDQDGLIHYAEPNYKSKLSESFETIKTIASNAPYSNINLAAAISEIENSGTSYAELAANGPVVAVLDSGIDYEHPSLASRLYQPKKGAAGCEGDTYGCNTTQANLGVLGDGSVYPVLTSGPGQACDLDGELRGICQHGTHVSGIIAGQPDTSEAFTGICPFCRILPIKIVGKTKYGTGSDTGIADSSIIAGLKYIINFVGSDSTSGIKIANMSFGKYQRSRTVGLLVSSLSKVNGGTLLIAAASNDDSIIRSYPAAFGSAIAVSSVDTDTNLKSYFSNFGKWVQISAYGDSINSTIPGGGHGISGGTSQATPMVAGVAGLVVAKENGNISATSLSSRILSTANPSFYSEVAGNKVYYQPADGSITNTPLLGYGIVDAEKAVKGESVAQRIVIAGNDRVSSEGCGSISSGKKGLSLLLFILLPIVILLTVSLMKAYRHS